MPELIEILHPVRTVKLRTAQIEVRELSWVQLKAFLRDLGVQVSQLFDSENTFAFTPVKIADMIKDSQHMSERLVLQSTGMDAPWLETLSQGEFFGILDAAVELNLKVFTDGTKKVGGHLQAAFGDRVAALAPTKISQAPSSSS